MPICFIETSGNIKPLDLATRLYESGNWKVSLQKAEQLVGDRIYFCDKQAAPSFFGGVIQGYRVLPNDDPVAPGRIVFSFIADAEGRGFSCGADGWGNEQKTID
jgi:hypothetical protein